MIVCSCYGISDRTIRQAVDDGADSILDVSMTCDAGGGCGSCHETLASLLALGRAARADREARDSSRACAA